MPLPLFSSLLVRAHVHVLRTRTSARMSLAAIAATLTVCAVDHKPAYAQTPAPPGEYIPDDDGAPQEVPVGDGDEYSDTDPSAATDFRSTLDPYGTWVDDPTYGQIWVPSPAEVGPYFCALRDRRVVGV